ncbi:hypothetical protein [Chitinophaga ginsengisoli]|uniref:Uncharacterized protein n=1 Tax=Chitinophaga ginsengisoli TaxID=363837 RepID=A0A2P8FGN6_9BACT|nr:hypothetical protein [Chitinophaga ginsengisoli]PSL20864.1 hypothetical protein CLV42_12440 [Chitinophaga ginsengisoli]
MSKNSREGVKHAIQELAIGNYKSYPEEYGVQVQDTAVNVQSLAKGYWDSREIKEIQRDEKLGIHLEDYKQWTQEAFVTFMKNHEYSLS